MNIANQAWGLAQGLRARGHEVEVWEYGTSTYDYPCDRRIDVSAGMPAYLAALQDALQGGFDVVHLHFARSLVPEGHSLPAYWDLPLWRAMGVSVVATFHGTDVRLRSHHLQEDEWSFYRFADVPSYEDLIADRLRVIRAYASHLTVGSVLDLPYVEDAVYLPKVIDTEDLVAPPLRTDVRRPVIAHAPSRRALKGTDMVLAGLDRLRAEGLAFDVDLIEGVDNAEAVARLARADIVVEKVLGGDVGVTSMEAMALGRVAVTRIRDQVRAQHPDLPAVSADPDTFADVLRDLLSDPERRARLGQEGRAYVERVHGLEAGGRRLEELYQRKGRGPAVGYPGWPLPATDARLAAAERALTRARAAAQRRRGRIQALRANLDAARTERDLAVDELARLRDSLAEQPERARRFGRPRRG
ncbi:putative aminotransferase, class-II [Pimelobacter simplex]|uniref:Putative aminotransferase, class-II n=1 Tax=Nocardioides simplex TaxID=2045 RepID=A0A0A1DFM4_NOCSI|nr:putative aminotransferase, class-II [Pimelobacter simplex]